VFVVAAKSSRLFDLELENPNDKEFVVSGVITASRFPFRATERSPSVRALSLASNNARIIKARGITSGE